MIRAAFFDLGNTLCDYQTAGGTALERACEYAVGHAPALTTTGLREAYLREIRHAEQEAARLGGSRSGHGDVLGVGHRLWSRALENCGVANSILAHAVACHYELSRMRALRPFPDALPALQALQGRLRVGVIAEGSPGIVYEELNLLDLRGLASVVVIAEEAGYARRDPSLFAYAVSEAGCEPAQAAHVGDSLALDVAPARQAGLVTVWLDRSGKGTAQADATPPDYTVQDLQAVPELLLGG